MGFSIIIYMFDTNDLTLMQSETKSVRKNYGYDDVVHINRSFILEGNYDDFTETLYPHGFVFYDFEVFKYDWLVVLIDPVNKTKTIIANERNALQKYFDENCNKVWTGYNNIHYDVPILKGILMGMNPKEVSDAIIVEGKNPWEINREFNKIKVLSFDCSDGINSLKVLEAYMGNNIEETEVPFDIDRPLTKKEVFQTIHYCVHDVEQTIEVFRRRINEWNASVNIIEMFDLPFENISKTKGQLTALVVGCEPKPHDDEFDITVLPCVELDKYKYVQDWFLEAVKSKNYSAKLETMVCGIPHQFGWGGLHGASDKPVHVSGRIFHADVGSYYPSMMLQWGLLTRNCQSPEKFQNVYDTRMELKKKGLKEAQAPYKIILNSQFGITKDKYSSAFDPVQANNICVNGQLMLLDLIEHLEKIMGDTFELLQSNTDGIIVKIQDDDKSERIFTHICNEWCIRTRMTFAYDRIGIPDRIGKNGERLDDYVAKDVNNYIFIFSNGKLERKGAYVKGLSDLDNNLPIVNKALVKYISEGIPVEDTINSSNDMIDFQQVVRVSKSFKYGWHNGQEMTDKTYRVYASKNLKDSYIGRCRDHGETPNKFGSTPDHCFIYNKEVKGVPLLDNVDRKWYINLAKKRLQDFGYEIMENNALF